MGTHVKRTDKQMEDLKNLASEFVLVGEGVSGGPIPEKIARIPQIAEGIEVASKFARKLWKEQPKVAAAIGAGCAIGLGVLAAVMIYRARRA